MFLPRYHVRENTTETHLKLKKHTSSERGYVAVIDPAVRTPELQSFNKIASWSPIPLHYHMPALHGMGSLLAEQKRKAPEASLF